MNTRLNKTMLPLLNMGTKLAGIRANQLHRAMQKNRERQHQIKNRKAVAEATTEFYNGVALNVREGLKESKGRYDNRLVATVRSVDSPNYLKDIPDGVRYMDPDFRSADGRFAHIETWDKGSGESVHLEIGWRRNGPLAEETMLAIQENQAAVRAYKDPFKHYVTVCYYISYDVAMQAARDWVAGAVMPNKLELEKLDRAGKEAIKEA